VLYPKTCFQECIVWRYCFSLEQLNKRNFIYHSSKDINLAISGSFQCCLGSLRHLFQLEQNSLKQLDILQDLVHYTNGAVPWLPVTTTGETVCTFEEINLRGSSTALQAKYKQLRGESLRLERVSRLAYHQTVFWKWMVFLTILQQCL
jgi:hypothetical protein